MSSTSSSSPDALFSFSVSLGPCDKYVTTSRRLNLYLLSKKTEWDSFSENIATRIFIGLTTPFPEDWI